MEKTLTRLIVAVVITVLITSAAYSELLVYEPFDYNVGDLAGNSGAFGLVWGWDDWWGDIPSKVGEGNLIHPIYEIDAVGNHAEIIDGGIGEGFATPLYDDGQDIWFGFLYQYVPGSEWGAICLFFYDEQSMDFAALVDLWGGYPGISTYYTGGEVQRANVDDPQAVLWIVIKAETSGSPDTTEMIYMWVDPVPESEPVVADADVALEYNIALGSSADHIHLIGQGDPIAYRIDEIRIGRQFSDVCTDIFIGVDGSARNPYPEDGTDDIDASAGSITLTWENGYDPESDPENPVIRDDVESYILYFGTNPNVAENPLKSVPVVDRAGSSTESIDYQTTYYWRVDQVLDDASVVQGHNWQFETQTEPPPTLLDNVIEAIEEAIAQKTVALDAVEAALASEQTALDLLNEMLDTGDYCGLTKQEIDKTIKKLEISIAGEGRVITDLQDSIFWLERILSFLDGDE